MASSKRSAILDVLAFILGPVLMALTFGRWREASGLAYESEVEFRLVKVWEIGPDNFTVWGWGPTPESLFVIGLGLLCWGVVRKIVWR